MKWKKRNHGMALFFVGFFFPYRGQGKKKGGGGVKADGQRGGGGLELNTMN